jgi:hypothetical protein
MYLVGRNFYSKFLPGVREVAGDDAHELIERIVGGNPLHQWIQNPNLGNPILRLGDSEKVDG